MAIEETRKKIHFTPFDIKKGRAVDESPAPTMTLTAGSLRFNKSLTTELNLNGKFVKLYSDPIKNVIGFQIGTEVIDHPDLKGWKLVNANPDTGMWTVSIRKMLEQQFGEKTAEKKYGKLPVRKYVEANGMDRGMTIYFVELVDEVTNEPKKPITESTVPVNEADLDKALDQLVTS